MLCRLHDRRAVLLPARHLFPSRSGFVASHTVSDAREFVESWSEVSQFGPRLGQSEPRAGQKCIKTLSKDRANHRLGVTPTSIPITKATLPSANCACQDTADVLQTL